MISTNEIVRDLGQFLDRLLDPSLSSAEKALYLKARAANMRERLRFLSLPESKQVAACNRRNDELLALLGAAILQYGRIAEDSPLERRLELPATSIDLTKQTIFFSSEFPSPVLIMRQVDES